MRPQGSPEELEKRRLRAIALLKKEYQPVDVARMVGVDRRSVSCWKAAYLKAGDKAIKGNVPVGPKSSTRRPGRNLSVNCSKGRRRPDSRPTSGHVHG